MTDIDLLEKKVAALMREIDSAVAKGHRITIETDTHNGGDDYEDGDSNPSMDASNSDDSDDDNGNGNPGNDNNVDDDDDDEEDDDDLGKAERWAAYQATNSAADRPGALRSDTHRSPGLGNSPAVQPSGRHKFDALTDKIQREENVSKTEAQSRARHRHPDVYASYQDHLSGSSAQSQQSERSRVRGTYNKRAPVTAEDYIAAEIRKGFSPEMAAQRVAQLHGFRAFDRVDAITKRSNDLAATFEGVAEVGVNAGQIDTPC
jgi:hypothetical protein